ncbi:MAG: hypothetical protein KGQ42_00370 [Alphaproteobacteria bacterium]|nr:hypothetical protein [Alphaproteobacteria bacterium]MDE2042314.1 hypothetical protein [Alphaproteobacteria bacterium]MDE2340052.1 hypothetical protein [Alphaproteobacteria bacterium]
MRRLLALMVLCIGAPTFADDVAASAPQKLSVTVYRAPWRNGGSLDLGNLGGFALIKETRTVHLPAGESKLRFEGVVDGIIPESAIVTGLPSGVIEKNRDAALLSPSALMHAAIGSDVTLRITNRKTGKVQAIPATVRSASEDGVVFQTAQGIQALQCSGMPETFTFARVPSGLSAQPTLSVLTRSTRAITATITLTYLAEHFDWAADYTATLNPDGRTLELGAWITLANANSISLPGAQTQIVAGRLNRAWEQQFFNPVPRVIARCWPSATTSTPLHEQGIVLVRPYGFEEGARMRGDMIMVTAQKRGFLAMAVPAPAMAPPPPPPPPPPPEQLGDLKLYRIPFPTNIAANGMKQTRLLAQHGVAYTRLYRYEGPASPYVLGGSYYIQRTMLILKTHNDKAHQLGLPLPAGQVTVEQRQLGRAMLIGQPELRDTAEDEDVELTLGPSSDVQVRVTPLHTTANMPEFAQLAPNVRSVFHSGSVLVQAEVSNATSAPQPVELKLQLAPYRHAIGAADHAYKTENGNAVFKLMVPANDRTLITYVIHQL